MLNFRCTQFCLESAEQSHDLMIISLISRRLIKMKVNPSIHHFVVWPHKVWLEKFQVSCNFQCLDTFWRLLMRRLDFNFDRLCFPYKIKKKTRRNGLNFLLLSWIKKVHEGFWFLNISKLLLSSRSYRSRGEIKIHFEFFILK